MPDHAETAVTVMIADAAEVPAGTMRLIAVDAAPVLVVNVGGDFYAMQGLCAHEEFELDEGYLTGTDLTCGLHGARFDVSTGEALDAPAEQPLAQYRIDVRDGQLWLEVPASGLELNSDLRAS